MTAVKIFDITNKIISVNKRYSLKTVSIVVVCVFLSVMWLGGCSKGNSSNTDSQGYEHSMLLVDYGDMLDNLPSEIDDEQAGNDASGNSAIDNNSLDGSASDGNSNASNNLAEDAYGIYPIELKKHYLWQCDGDNEKLYLLTNPNINVHLRGAVLATDISVTGGTTCVATTIVPIYLKSGDTVTFTEYPGMSRRVYMAKLDREACVYNCVYYTEWQDIKDETIVVSEDSYLVAGYTFSNVATEDTSDTDTTKLMTDSVVAELIAHTQISRNSSVSEYENLYADNDALLAELEITEGRSKEGNPYILIKVPSELSNGQQVMPELSQTSWMKYYEYPCYDRLTDTADKILFRSVLSPMMYSQIYHTAFTINAGLFNIFSNTPQGQCIIDGEVVTNNPMKDDIGDPISPDTECYAMTIDAAGILDYAKHENGAPYRTIDAYSLVEQGCRDAITGWGCIVYDGVSVVELNPSAVTSSTIFYEQVHKRKVAHQVIGQDRAGNYYILSTNDIDSGYGYGLNYDEAADIMIEAGATYAYMLDGGDSVATVVNGEQLTTIYYEDYGKPVPTVINFVAK